MGHRYHGSGKSGTKTTEYAVPYAYANTLEAAGRQAKRIKQILGTDKRCGPRPSKKVTLPKLSFMEK